MSTTAAAPEAVNTSCPRGCAPTDTAPTSRPATDRRFGTPGTYRVVHCPRCVLARTEPQPADPADGYPDGYYAYAPPAEPSPRVARRLRAFYHGRGSRRSRWLDLGLPPRVRSGVGSVLDVGCGSGAFLLALQSADWQVAGVEPDDHAARLAREAGLDVRTGDLTETDLPKGSFDVVRFWHSLEHTRNPVEQLAAANRALKPGGTLVIGVPHYASLLSAVFRDRWFYLDVPRHLWHFHKSTLRELVTDSGFQVTRNRFTSTSVPLLGTLDFAFGRGERLVNSRGAWYAALPVSMLLDAARVGDAIELHAIKQREPNVKPGREIDRDLPVVG